MMNRLEKEVVLQKDNAKQASADLWDTEYRRLEIDRETKEKCLGVSIERREAMQQAKAQ